MIVSKNCSETVNFFKEYYFTLYLETPVEIPEYYSTFENSIEFNKMMLIEAFEWIRWSAIILTAFALQVNHCIFCLSYLLNL